MPIAWLVLVCAPQLLQDREAAASRAAPPAERAPTARVELRIEPFVELWFEVRALAQPGPQEVPPALARSVQAAKLVQAELGSGLAFGVIEGLFDAHPTGAKMRAAIAELPERTSLGGREVAVRDCALALADALIAAEPAWRDQIWPARATALVRTQRELEAALLSKQDELYAFHTRSLGIDVHDLVIPVYLVTSVPTPGAITHRGTNGGVCFVTAHEGGGSELVETVVHESTHALDIAWDGDVFDQLREKLAARGLARTDKLYRDIPHTLMFVQSAQSVRRVLAPEHVDYGVQAKYYDKVRAVADAELRIWPQVLDGKLALDAALDALCAELVPAAK
ncbi:MAG: hypothetical protein EPO68_02030 [Planctomycetota bacterium]|nr:MAG: hypothetical protein EPO68_02030 [Planctomycetota bacterium]